MKRVSLLLLAGCLSAGLSGQEGVDSVCNLICGRWFLKFEYSGWGGGGEVPLVPGDSSRIWRIRGTDSIAWIKYHHCKVAGEARYRVKYSWSSILREDRWMLLGNVRYYTGITSAQDIDYFSVNMDYYDGSSYVYARLDTISVGEVPVITGTRDSARCGPGSVTLGASASMGTVNWYADPSVDTVIASGTSFVTPALSVTTSYYVDATAGECTSPIRAKVTAQIVYADSCPSAAGAFAPVGAEWYYEEGFAFSGDIGYMKFRSEKDTLFEGRLCRKLVKENKMECNNRPGVEFLYTSNDTVYFWDPDFGVFQVLYVFSASKEDSWSLKILDKDSTVDTLVIRVDDAFLSSINGHELRSLDVIYTMNGQWDFNDPYTSKIIEKIGDVQYMFNWYPWEYSTCDMNYSAGLRCYEDGEIGLYSTGRRDSCNFVMHPYEPLTAYSPSWNVVKGNLWGVGTDSMVLKGDTAIDGKHYYKIHYYDLPSKIKLDVEGYLRENINTGQAWYRANVDPVDRLIMDLSLEVGDSFYVEGPWSSCPGYRKVDSVWTESGRKRVRVDANINPAFGGLYDEKLTFIEGVGTNIGVGYKVFNYMDNFPYLLCACYGSSVIYRNKHPEYKNVCMLRTTDTEDLSGSSGIALFPNPTNGMVSLGLNGSLRYRFRISDITGRTAGSGVISGSQLDLSAYPDGIYILTLWPETDFTKKQVFKIIKR